MFFSVIVCLLVLVGVHGQDPRKRLVSPLSFDDMELNKNFDEISCSLRTCFKRSSGQDDLGPFWANRGKRQPHYSQNRLFAEEPNWILVRSDEPFLHSRGKKDNENIFGNEYYWKNWNGLQPVRERREFAQVDLDTPFFASRGKRVNGEKNQKSFGL